MQKNSDKYKYISYNINWKESILLKLNSSLIPVSINAE